MNSGSNKALRFHPAISVSSQKEKSCGGVAAAQTAANPRADPKKTRQKSSLTRRSNTHHLTAIN